MRVSFRDVLNTIRRESERGKRNKEKQKKEQPKWLLHAVTQISILFLEGKIINYFIILTSTMPPVLQGGHARIYLPNGPLRIILFLTTQHLQIYELATLMVRIKL